MIIKNKKIILIVAIAIVGLLFFVIVCLKSPTVIIKEKLYITLPSTSKIINFDYHWWSETFDAKILIDDQDVESVKNELLKHLREKDEVNNKHSKPYMENTTS